MNRKKYILMGLFFLVFISTVVLVYTLLEPKYIIEGDSVYIDDSNVFINVTPHTSNNPIIELKTKAFTGNIDVVFGFNSNDVVPLKAEYNPQLVNVTKSYVCTGTYFNFTTSPNQAWCWYNGTNINSTKWLTLLFSHSFTSGNVSNKTIFWSEQETQWTDISGIFTQVNTNFQDYDKWYYKTNVHVTAGQTYKVRVSLDVKTAQKQKWYFGVKPSSQTLEQAIQAGTFYYIDPWTEYLRSHGKQQTNFATEDSSNRGLAIIPSVDINLSKVTFYVNHRGSGVGLYFANGTFIANYTNSTEIETNTTVNFPLKAGIEYYICSRNQGVSAWGDPSAYPYNMTYVNFTTSIACGDTFVRQNNVVREILSITISENTPCVYSGSGDWEIDSSFNCVLSTNTDIGSNTLLLTGNEGLTTINAVIQAGKIRISQGTIIKINQSKMLIAKQI